MKEAIKFWLSWRLADLGLFVVIAAGVIVLCAVFIGVSAAVSAISKKAKKKQTWDLSDALAFQHYEYKQDDPEFDRRIFRREATKELLDLAMRAACNGDYAHFRKTEDVQVALDMYSVIRNFFWHQLPEDKREDWTVDADPVYIWGPEPKITVKKEGE